MSGLPVGLLTAVTFLPALGAVVLAFVPRGRDGLLRSGALLVSLATFALSVPLYVRFDADSPDFQFGELLRWMPNLGVGYHVGIDGISLLLVLLTTFLMPVALASAWHAIEERTKEFVMAMLVLETAVMGVFPSDHVIGSVHCVFRFGPVGPLKKAGWSSPHRPLNPIQGNSLTAVARSLGIVTTAGRTTRSAFRVSSHPTPCDPDAPRYSAWSKKPACEPEAGYTTGCEPPTISSLSSPQPARSPPVCWL